MVYPWFYYQNQTKMMKLRKFSLLSKKTQTILCKGYGNMSNYLFKEIVILVVNILAFALDLGLLKVGIVLAFRHGTLRANKMFFV